MHWLTTLKLFSNLTLRAHFQLCSKWFTWLSVFQTMVAWRHPLCRKLWNTVQQRKQDVYQTLQTKETFLEKQWSFSGDRKNCCGHQQCLYGVWKKNFIHLVFPWCSRSFSVWCSFPCREKTKINTYEHVIYTCAYMCVYVYQLVWCITAYIANMTTMFAHFVRLCGRKLLRKLH